MVYRPFTYFWFWLIAWVRNVEIMTLPVIFEKKSPGSVKIKVQVWWKQTVLKFPLIELRPWNVGDLRTNCTTIGSPSFSLSLGWCFLGLPALRFLAEPGVFTESPDPDPAPPLLLGRPLPFVGEGDELFASSAPEPSPSPSSSPSSSGSSSFWIFDAFGGRPRCPPPPLEPLFLAGRPRFLMPGEIAATAAVEDLPPTDAFDGRPRFFYRNFLHFSVRDSISKRIKKILVSSRPLTHTRAQMLSLTNTRSLFSLGSALLLHLFVCRKSSWKNIQKNNFALGLECA